MRKNNSNPIIKCTVDIDGKKIYHNFERNTPIKEVKRSLKMKYQELYNKPNYIDKEIVFYCDGKPITNENEQIGNITEGADVNFEMLSVSLNDSSIKDDFKIQEKIINKVSSNCKEHEGNKELLICVDCGKSICELCQDKHSTHKKLYKKELINSGKELKQKSNEINNTLIECGFSDSRGCNNICMEEKQRINSNIDMLQKMVDEIKKASRHLNNNFNKVYDDIYPLIVDYKEKIKKLNAKSLHIQTMKNERDFLDYYYSYSEIKRKENKILECISSLKRQKDTYQETIKEFNSGSSRILEKIKEDYNFLINLQYKEDMEALGRSSFYRKTVDKTLGSITTKQLGGGTGKMSLINLLVPKERSRLIDNEKISYINKKKILKNNENAKSAEINTGGGDEPQYNLICGIEPNSKNMFIFDKNEKKVNKINLNFQGLHIDKFLNCFSTLNYKGRFYLSGGFQHPKAFFRLNYGAKTLLQLNNMPSGHNYHGMIGINDNIYSVSGYKNTNVEKYEISRNSWSSLTPLEVSFSWPGLLIVENKFLYVFGGLCEIVNTNNKKIYKMNITSPDSKWEGIDINSNLEKIPFYSGFVQINDKNILILGGKFSSIENNVDKCFNFNFDSNSLNQDGEYKLPNRDIFNGKNFCDLGGGLFGEFSCFSYNKFYLVNTSSKSIDVFE